jgi:uncharacterized protein (TIGR02996 family)
MTPDDAFLQAIIESPDDDSPRLIYADYLEEHGQPERAELVRVQCELARCEPWTQSHRALAGRGASLLEAHADSWAGPLGLNPYPANFRRGFVERDAFAPSRFLALAPRVFERTPLRQVDLMVPDAGGHVYTGRRSPEEERLRDERIVGSDLLTPVRVLKLFGLGHETGVKLAASPHVGLLEELGLYGGAAAEAWGPLARGRMSGMRRLSLSVYDDPSPGEPGDSGLEVLSRSPLAPLLEDLYLRGMNVTAAGAAHLAAPAWEGLRSLYLHDNPVGDAGVAALLRSPHASNWTSLGLVRCSLTGRSARLISGCSALSRLYTLRIDPRGARERDLAGLIRSPHLAGLRELSLHGVNPDKLLTVASEMPEAGRLRRLVLGDASKMTDAGVEALLRQSPLDQVASIFFSAVPRRGSRDLFARLVAKLGPRFDSY